MAATMVALRNTVFRVLLLGMLAVGVVSMHTIGHSGHHDGWAAVATVDDGADHLAAVRDMTPIVKVRAAGVHLCDQGYCGAAEPTVSDREPGPGGPNDGASIVIMCLAVLCAFGLLALLAAALARRYRRLLPPHVRVRAAAIRPAEPTSLRGYALTLVEVAVLRT